MICFFVTVFLTFNWRESKLSATFLLKLIITKKINEYFQGTFSVGVVFSTLIVNVSKITLSS